jgi:hypothetical protein
MAAGEHSHIVSHARLPPILIRKAPQDSIICRCLVIRYLGFDRRECKSVRLISREHKTRDFRLVQALA